MSFYTVTEETVPIESPREEWGDESELEAVEDESTDAEIDSELRRIRSKRLQTVLPFQIPSEEDCTQGPEILLSSSDEDPMPLPRKPKKKFFENRKFYVKDNKPVLPRELWDEEENLDNIETLMNQTEDVKELDAAPMEGAIDYIKPNLRYDDVIYKNVSTKIGGSSGDSNFDLILSSSDEERIPRMKIDHYKQLLLADDRLIDCHLSRKPCRTMPPTKYYGLNKILERKERYKSLRGKSTLLSANNPAASSYEGSSFSPSGSLKKKRFKLKEPFPKKDSLDKTLSSMSSVEGSSESDRNEPRVDPSKLFSKCKWYEDCIFKVLFKLAVRRERKLATVKTELDFDVDEMLDNLYTMSRDPRNFLYNKVVDDFVKYKEEFFKKTDVERTNKTDETEEIKLWSDVRFDEKISVQEGDFFQTEPDKRKRLNADVSGRLYRRIARKETPRAKVEARLTAERALDVKKKKNIIQKKFKPIEINPEALPEAMNDYFRDKEIKRRKEREVKPKDDDFPFKKKVDKKEEKARMSATSLHPSYTKLIPPYSNVCKERIQKTLKKYRKMFDDELQSLAEQQTFALAGVALRRMYLITMGKAESPIKFTESEEIRLHRLLDF